MKQAVIYLTNEQLTDDQTSLLKIEPNFVSTNKKILFMDINSTTALDLENWNKGTDTEPLRQKLSEISSKNLN